MESLLAMKNCLLFVPFSFPLNVGHTSLMIFPGNHFLESKILSQPECLGRIKIQNLELPRLLIISDFILFIVAAAFQGSRFSQK